MVTLVDTICVEVVDVDVADAAEKKFTLAGKNVVGATAFQHAEPENTSAWPVVGVWPLHSSTYECVVVVAAVTRPHVSVVNDSGVVYVPAVPAATRSSAPAVSEMRPAVPDS